MGILSRVMKKVAPPPKMTGIEWVVKYRRYPIEGPSPGRHDPDKAPYQTEPINCCTDDVTKEVTCMWSSQVGKTTIVENTIAVRATVNPGPMMLVNARIEDAEDFSKDRLMPMIRATPKLREVFGEEKQKNSGNTILKKKFFGGFLKMGGANSPASLAMRAIRDLFLDEKDRYPASAGDEGDPSALAKKRTATFFNSKIVNISSPGIKGHSAIEKDYQRSDMREYYVACPHCKTDIILKHEQLKCDNNDPETTYYVCQACDVIIDEDEKPRMMRETGKWIAQKPFQGHAGFKITEMYSPFRRWADIMKDWIEAKSDPEKMKVFINTSKAETYEISGEKLNHEILYARREKYKIGTVPFGGLFLTASADVQKNRIEVEVKAWGRGKQSWSVLHEILVGDTSSDEVWKQLDDILELSFPHESGASLQIRLLGVDSGYRTENVYAFVRRYPISKVVALKGKAGQIAMVAPPKMIDVKRSGKKPEKGVKVWMVGVDIIKSETVGNLAKKKPSDEQLANGEQYPSGYCHYPEYREDFFKQLTAEVLVPRKAKNGQIVYEWVKIEERNEALDLHVYNRACAHIIGIDRFQEKHWRAIEEALQIPSPVDQQTKASHGAASEPVKRKPKNKVIIKGSGFLDR